jgi:hypothetical protein
VSARLPTPSPPSKSLSTTSSPASHRGPVRHSARPAAPDHPGSHGHLYKPRVLPGGAAVRRDRSRAGVGWSTPHPDADWADFLDALRRGSAASSKDRHDFGDGWAHTIKIEPLADPEPEALYPRLIEVTGRCPPEDSAAPGANSSPPSRIQDMSMPDSWNGLATIAVPARFESEGFSDG